MQQTPDPTQRFLVSAFANFARMILTPLYFAIRTDMGVQYSGFYAIFSSLILYGVGARLIALKSEQDGHAAALFVGLVALGYIRNLLQANSRRRTLDWSVNSWSTGASLLEPVLFLLGTALCKKSGEEKPIVRRLARSALNLDFIYYVAEPATLLAVAVALWSIGSILWIYVAALAVGLVFVRYHAKLRLYLRAHELADAQMFERALMSQFEGPIALVGTSVAVAEIPAAPVTRQAENEHSTFDRLSPELQMLLARDRAEKR
ncbi:MAG: hypothetical protein P4L99_17170 [Chthoniobacter sp.]|nr:hypothetical protein [Chthoniobacter sp.]